jgi:Ca2+-binding RTX toxin-like protein
MTESANDLARRSLNAQGAYAQFGSPRTTEEALSEAGSGDFTTTQAQRFLVVPVGSAPSTSEGFVLLHHQPNQLSGFSASVFLDKAQNKYVLSIRGTEGLVDISEDVNRIGLRGFAGGQAVDLYRYYRRLTTPTGQAVIYSESEIGLLNSLRLGLPVRLPFASPAALPFKLDLARDVGVAPLAGTGPSVIPPGTPLVITGHSLGGHLALLYGRMFPDVTEHVYTYNAPGINLIGEGTLRTLGIGPIDASKVTNVAARMGEEPISRIWSKPGENVGIFTEPGSALHQHSIVPLADSLALYGAFATLSPGLAGDPAAVSGIIAAASPYPEDSLEVTLDALRATLGTDAAPTLIARERTDLVARESYYENLYALLDARSPGHDYGIVSLAGKSAGEIASMAESDVSVRFALSEMLPFAATNADFSSFEDDFSGQWLASRAEWLSAMLEGNQAERVFGFSGTADNLIFIDVDAGRRYAKLDGIQGNLAVQISALADRSRIQDFLGAAPYNRSVVFGSDSEGDQLQGLSGGDRLFGAAGDDSLDGADGNDYLEGGEGADTLTGGAGDDTLAGGTGTDRLEGGAGRDAYLLSGELDADTIVDRDGLIYAGGTVLTGGTGPEGGPFESSDGRFSYAFSGDLASEGTLVVNGSLRVEGFRNGDLGIRLTRGIEQPDQQLPALDFFLYGDVEFSFPPDRRNEHPVDQYGNPMPWMIATPVPGRADWHLELPGTPGNTLYSMGGGDDTAQDLFGGDDYFQLGSGDDAGFGGRGNDVMEGGAGRDMIAGGVGDDALHAGTVQSVEADLSDQAAPASSNGGDLLSGGDGDDAIFGDGEANLIGGGTGRDKIFGGAGDDWIGADVSIVTGNYGVANPFKEFGFLYNAPVDLGWGREAPPSFSLTAAPGFGTPGIARINGTQVGVPSLVTPAGDADEIDAGAGNDTIFGEGGNDVIFGGGGNDYIHAGTGNDTVFAGDGNDYVLVNGDSLGDQIDAGEGNDQVTLGVGNDTAMGGGGNDSLFSFGGNDFLFGGAGIDFLGASNGASVLDGGAGDDLMSGSAPPGQAVRMRVGRGSGSDRGVVTSGTLVIEVVGDVSPHEVSVARGERIIPARDGGGPAFETIYGIEISIGTGGDSLFLEDLPPVRPYVPKSIEFADGTVWDDAYLQSLLEPDATPNPAPTVTGTAAGDLLYGSAGADTFTSNQGDDWLVGGAGNDSYQYAQGDGFDLIEDVDASPGNADVLQFADGIEAENVEVFATGDDYLLKSGDGGVRIRGGRTQAGAIERVEFAASTAWSSADLEARAQLLPDNRAPLMPASFGNVDVDPATLLQFAIPVGAITDPDPLDSLSYYAITAEGERLPDWLVFDAEALTFTGTPAAGDAGAHEVLLIAADESGAAAFGTLTISVGGSGTTPDPDDPVPAGSEVIVDSYVPAPLPTPGERTATYSDAITTPLSSGDSSGVGIPLDPLFRDMQRRFDVLLQTGRTNLGERYAEAIREFEERRLQREEVIPPPPSEEEIEAWNSAMHAWHDRNPGFAETDSGGNDGTWTVGWGLPGPSEGTYGGSTGAGALPGLANPMATSRLKGAVAAPMLGEGLKEIR